MEVEMRMNRAFVMVSLVSMGGKALEFRYPEPRYCHPPGGSKNTPLNTALPPRIGLMVIRTLPSHSKTMYFPREKWEKACTGARSFPDDADDQNRRRIRPIDNAVDV